MYDRYGHDTHGDSLARGDTKGFWKKAEEILAAELYTDFVPRWYKKRTALSGSKMKAAVGWVAPSIKLAIGVGLSPGLWGLELGQYETGAAALCLYLVADATYQLLDLQRPYSLESRKAATLALDLLTYPVHAVSARTR